MNSFAIKSLNSFKIIQIKLILVKQTLILVVKSLIYIEYIFNCNAHISLLSLFTYLYMCVSNLVDMRVFISYAMHRICLFTYYDTHRICKRYVCYTRMIFQKVLGCSTVCCCCKHVLIKQTLFELLNGMVFCTKNSTKTTCQSYFSYLNLPWNLVCDFCCPT